MEYHEGRSSLSISIVTYQPNLAWLEMTLRSLAGALIDARRESELGETVLWMIDNTGTEDSAREIDGLLQATMGKVPLELIMKRDHGNVGYGVAHNFALTSTACDFHLVLNPDVMIAETALTEALRLLRRRPQVAMLAPDATDSHGNRQYLCKRYPAVLDLFLRAFAPPFVKQMFAKRLGRYELRDMIGDTVLDGVPIVSGCFMLMRHEAIAWTQGFDPQFFLYFEDFDFSLRIGQNSFAPQVRVMHFGGRAASKGLRHIALFARSAWRFYNKHGWRWV